ncbi:MAG: right-handed parallel beta-helix repeat-containing protein [Kiritimatiellae bacterium]|nr:right-handed parallel beta-helix repeat-containing protein [Kiritimatiellia bacterium]
MEPRQLSTLARLAVAAVFAAGASRAADIRLTPTHHDVAGAIAAAKPGDTLVLAGGRYEGGWKLPSGTTDSPIILKAECAGHVFIGKSPEAAGFQPAPGLRYTYVTDCAEWPYRIFELDEKKVLRHMASIVDAETVIGSYHFDATHKKLYLHPSYGDPPAKRRYVILNKSTGLKSGSHNVIDGLAMTGFGEAAIEIRDRSNVTVRNCFLHLNGYGVSVVASSKIHIHHNRLHSNRPPYVEGAQIHLGGKISEAVVEHNLVLNTTRQESIRAYAGDFDGIVFRNNIGDAAIYSSQRRRRNRRCRCPQSGARAYDPVP